jgi:hypothetical protein
MRGSDRRGGRIGPTLGRRNDYIYERMNSKLFAWLFSLPLIPMISIKLNPAVDLETATGFAAPYN